MQPGTRPQNPLSWMIALAVVAVLSGGCGNSQEPTAKTEPATTAPAKSPESQQKPDTSSSSPATPPSEEAPLEELATEPTVEETPADSSEAMPKQEGEASEDSPAADDSSSDDDTNADADVEPMPAQTQPPTSANSNESGSSEPAVAESADLSIGPNSVPVPEAMPTVVMSDAHAKTCLVSVGDQFPDVTLNDPFDEPNSLASLLGEKLTVILLWNSRSPYAIAQLRDVQTEVQRRFGNSDVAVVGINVGDSADTVRDITAGANVSYPQLLDIDGSLYNQVATRCIPRVYLLDSQGKVIWLDLEHSVAAARLLSQAIAFQQAN